MAEIVVGLLGLAIELGKCIAEPVKRQLNYLCCLNSNVQNLKRESKKLDDARVGLQRRVTSAKNNAEVIAPEVETWLEDVNEIQEKVTAIDSENTNIQSSSGCLRVKSRYSLSKKVKKTTEAMKQLQGSCNFDVLSQPTPPAAMVSTPFVPMNEFESRKHIEEEIMRHLRDDNINMIGICGMGGVGKTTVAKKVMKRAREEHLFVEIVIAVVSQQVDMPKIQEEIAELLGLKLEEKGLFSRAHKLRARLSGGKRNLIVLDDVWKKLNLEELGIPCKSGFKECTILLTSRDRDVFDAMDVQKVCGIQTLSREEAWSLFRENAGTCVDDQNLLPIAQKIAEECKGLPLALVTLGVALKNKTENSIWEDALQQLENYNPVNIPNFPADVYAPLKLSYDFLDSRQARSIFLLCCLFPEDHNIPLEDLTVYAMGLGMFEDAKKLGQARNRTRLLIGTLKSRFLLLEGSDEYHVKMHDVVRDVSIFIASEERQINCNVCTWISPFLGERIGLSIESKFPNLCLLLTNNKAAEEELQNNDHFFEGMIELKVLSIESCDSLRSLPDTIRLLKNLRTLILYGCESLESISVVGELLSLEILICRWCDSLQDLPVEMGRLTHLKLIEFSDCESLEAIAPGVISRMVELEELKMVDSFDKWEAEVNEGNKRKNAGLRELESLTNLIRLEIEVADYSLVAKQIHLSPKIVKFDIAFGNVEYKPYYRTKGFHKKLHLGLRGEISLGDWINVQLLRNTEYLHSEGDGSNKLDLAKAQNMRLLCLRDCSTMKKLVNITTLMETTTVAFPLLESLALDCLPKLEGTCNTNGPDQGSSNSSFPNLKELTLKRLPALKHLWKLVCQNVVSNLSSLVIYKCDSLHNLFLVATAKDCLFQLESLTVTWCEKMEHVLLWNQEDNQKDTVESRFHITLPKLKRLKLCDLTNLTAFYKGMGSIEFPLLTEMEITKCPNLKSLVSATCSIESGNNQYNSGGIRHEHDDDDSLYFFCGPEKVTFGGLEILYLNGYSNALALWCHQIPVQFFAGLKDLKIEGCGSIRSLFSSSQAQNLVNLQKLNIRRCKEMIKVIEDKKEEKHAFGGETTFLFPNLKSLYLCSLTELKSFCEWECALKLESLEEVDISDCPEMGRFSLGSLTIPNLKGTRVDDVTSLAQDLNGMLQQQYFFRIEGSPNSAFQNLKELRLQRLPALKHLWKPVCQNVVSNLSSVEICECDSLHNLFLLATAKDCLFQLESLTVTRCEKMEQVLLWNQEDNQKDTVESRFHITFPKLRWLKLCDLPNLTAFYKGMGSIEFPLLTEMEITECPNLKSLVSATCSIESGNNQYNSGGIRHDHDDDDSLYFFCGPEKLNPSLDLET